MENFFGCRNSQTREKDYTQPRSHRPIQLIECMGKLVEKIVTKRLLFDAGKYELMPFNQFGGRSNASCTDAGLSLIHDIHTACQKGLVSLFLAIDIKGFFDHVNHKRMIHVLKKKGFPKEICDWTESFLSNRTVKIHIDDYTSDFFELTIGVPQGLPASPVLSCLYASEILEKINTNPIYSSEQLPVTPRSYVDDVGFLAISDSLEENIIILQQTLYKAEKHFNQIGMYIDPEKSDLMHFSWRKNDKKSPHLTALIKKQIVTIIPPLYIRWLGFYLDRKLSFKYHIDILCAKAKNIISGLTCLGNTISGLNQNNLRLLYKTCIIPVITYGSQLWFNPYHPKKLLINKLQVVQNLGLRRVTGTFRTTNTEALTILAYQPPIQITVHKLFESCAARFFRLPLSSEISLQLPLSFIPPSSPMHILIPGSSLSPKQHIPFIHPPFLREKPKKNPQKFSQITLLASTLEPDTERQLPYHDHCHPGTFCATSELFQDRLFLDWKPTPKKSRKTLVHKQNIVMANVHQSVNVLLILTDGSRIPDHGTGYSVVGYYMGEEIH